MKAILLVGVITLSVFAVCYAQIQDDNNALSRFQVWAKKYNKKYASGEVAQRFKNFQDSLERINKKNANSTNKVFGLTKFSDMTPEEFRENVLMQPRIPQRQTNVKTLAPKNGFGDNPAALDWREKGAVTAVKNQEQCGSCWAFSVTENVESQWILAGKATNTSVDLAPQQIVDCDLNDGGCNGGDPTSAYAYIIGTGGLESESDYPYTGENGNCHFTKKDVVAKISDWKYACESGHEDNLQDSLVTSGPLSICVDASNWQDYSGGVMTGWECAWYNILDHCVELVGYDTTASTPYWIVRNSWGTDWGQNGYILLQMWDNTCGLTEEATSSVV